ncbi:MAG: hypothetical protein ACREJG_05075 [Candidatus Rokuibacteriota bacterium]
MKRALEDEQIGLSPAHSFRLVSGRCPDCPAPAAALWYFRDELIAVPRAPGAASTFAAAGSGVDGPAPPLVWIAAPEVVARARLSAGHDALQVDGRTVRFAVVPPIPTNRFYIDHSTLAFFERRPIRLRGTTRGDGAEPVFVARTIWPADSAVDAARLRPEPLQPGEDVATLVSAQASGLEDPFATRLLWERADQGASRQWAGRAVLAFVLSGAQGDDDGAAAGHIAVATGRFGPGGEWADWLVNNFYPLDEPGEKGIVSAPVPMDNYLADLNSGQAYYRPVYVLVAVLRTDAAAHLAQSALGETFTRYYCHEFEFDRAALNSTEMTMETLRLTGWMLPRRGATSRLKAPAAFIAGLVTGGLQTAKDGFNFFTEERTHLFPRVAFEVAGHDLLDIAAGRAERPLTPYEALLARDLEALAFVRFPQIPSSRPFGTDPAGSIAEFRARVKLESGSGSSTPARLAFPEELKDTCASPGTRRAQVP